jgi:hypothetical protein
LKRGPYGLAKTLFPGFLILLILGICLWGSNSSVLLGWAGLEKSDGIYQFNWHGEKIPIVATVIDDSFKHLAVISGLTLLLWGLVGLAGVRLRLVQWCATVLIIADLMISNLTINPMVGTDFYDTAPAAQFLADQMKNDGGARFYRFDPDKEAEKPVILGQTDSLVWLQVFHKLTLLQFLSAKDHIYFSIFDPIDRLESLPSQVIGLELRQTQDFEAKLRFLSGLNVRYLLSLHSMQSAQIALLAAFEINSDRPLFIYHLKTSLPRALLIHPLYEKETGFTFGEFLTPLQPQEALPPNPSSNHLALGAAMILEYSSNRIKLGASATQPCLLLFLDSYYPGWKATIDGVETQVKCINNVFRGVDFPAGKHEVVFAYDPLSFRVGLWISLGMTMLCVLAFLLGRFYKSRAAKT